MTLRERIMAVYRRQTPDVVPFMLDLSHWFYHRNHLPWDLSKSSDAPESDLIAYHRKAGAGFYVPQLPSVYAASYPADVHAETEKRNASGGTEIVWRLTTPLGAIERRRVWEELTYAWAVSHWGVQTEQDLKVLTYALRNRTFSPRWEVFRAWDKAVGDTGVVYVGLGYSGIGQLLNYWMGIEQTMYAVADWPDTLRETVDAINANILTLVDLLAASPVEIVIMGDNISSDVQPPRFFNTWSRAFYAEAVRRLHCAGKFVAVHIDGRLRGAIEMVRATGADCGDAITPTPMGDLTPAECRAEAGRDFILSGGVAPNLWLPNAPVEQFKAKVMEWLELRRLSPALIANAGDQVPPGADESRIEIMRELVEKHGRY